MKDNSTTATGEKRERTKAYALLHARSHARSTIMSIASITPILLLLLVTPLLLTVSSIPVHAAEVTPRSVVLGESVLVRTTPGADSLVLYCDGQSFRFLGELEQTVAYKPSQLGTCTLQETQRDGSIVTSEFYVLDADAPLGVPSIIPAGQNAGGQTGAEQADAASADGGARATQGTTNGMGIDGTTNHSGSTGDGSNGSTDNIPDISTGRTGAEIGTGQGLSPAVHQTRLQELFLQEAMTQDPRLGTALLSRTWRKSAIAPQGTLASDERALSSMNRGVRAHSTRGTGWDAQVTIRTPSGRISGSTSDLGVVAPGGRGSVTFEFQERHVKRLTIDDADLDGDISIGIDEPEPSTIDPPHNDETIIKAYAIDPSAVSFTSGSATVVAEGTALYKCKDWVFYDRTCAGTWERVMDITPGQEYDIALSPADPGFIESAITLGVPTAQSMGEIVALGGIPAPVKNTRNHWGIVFLNPTNQTLNITWVRFRSSLSTFASIAAVKPSSGWVFSSATMVNWTGSVLVGPQNMAEFIVNITGVNTNQLNSIITVQVNASGTIYTNAGYATHATNAALQYPSVYFVNSTNTSAYVVDDVVQNESADYTLRIHNAGTTTIPIGTMHNIYIPPGWRNVTMAPQTGWTTGTVMGDEGSGWYLLPQITNTIAAGQWQDIVIGATPPQSSDTELYNWQVKLISSSAQTARAITSSFEPGLRVINDTPLLSYEDGRYEETRVGGGSRYVDQYASIPAPGDSPGVNRWAVVVVNPTDEPINVTQIDITSNVNIFTGGRGIAPAVTWSNISQSNHRWNGTVTIPAHSAAEFASNIVLTAATTTRAIITVTTQTTAGTITSSGFPTGQSTGSIQYPSVYAVDGGTHTNIVNTTSDTSNQFRIRINNSGSSATVPIGTRLEITLPPGWRDIVPITTTVNWTVDQVVTDASGGSTIRARTLGSTIATNSYRDFVFDATSPIVGTNSTYRFDILFFGGTAQTTTQPMQTHTQLAARVTTTAYGLNITRRSENLTDIGNITSVRIRAITSSAVPTYFNFSIRRPGAISGANTWETLRNDTLDTSWSEWTSVLATNRTYDSREYIDRDTGSSNYSAALVRWHTTSNNQTSLHEDLLEINVTYDQSVPSISLISPDDMTYINVTSILFQADTADDHDLRNCSVSINGVRNTTNSTPANASTTTFNISSLADNAYNWSVDCYDLVGNRNMTANRTITVDTIPPAVILNAPTINARLTNSTVTFNITPYDQNIANCSLLIDDIINETNTTPASGQSTIFTVSIPDGNHSWTAECVDLAGNTYRNATRNFSVDTVAPAYGLILASPVSGEEYNGSQSYTFNITWTDSNDVDNVTIEANFTGAYINYTSTRNGDEYSLAHPTLAAGTYLWRSWANDTYGNRNMTNDQTYVVQRTSSDIALLLNDTTSNYPVDINESVNITGIVIAPIGGYAELYVQGILVTSGAGPLQNITSFSTNGSKNVTLIYPESQNHTASSITLFIVVGDKAGPNTTVIYPNNGSVVGAENVTFRFNITDATGIENCSLYINGTLNTTIVSGLENNAENNITVNGFIEGDYRYRISCYDPIGNRRNSTNVTFTVDLTSPGAFNLTAPPNNTVSKNQSPTLMWQSSSDTHFRNYVALIDNAFDFSSPNYIYNTTGTSYIIDDALPSGIWYWRVDAYDQGDNTMTAPYFAYIVDLVAPQYTSLSPQNSSYQNTTTVNVTFSFSDITDVTNCTLFFNDSTTYSNTTLNQTGDNAFIVTKPDGGYLWHLECVDEADNTNISEERTLIVDTVPPTEITLLTPSNNTFTNNNTPTLAWSQTVESHFKNYTIIVSDNETFPHVNMTYGTFDIATTAYDVIAAWTDGTWYWKIIAYDLAGNSVDPFFVYTIDSTPPAEFTLISPPDNTAGNDRTPTLEWSGSSDQNFANYTIIVTDSPSFEHINMTYNVSDNNTLVFTPTIDWDDNTVWRWKVIAYDNASNGRNSSQIFTYTTDNAAPVVRLVIPPNNTLFQSGSSSLITFKYNVSDLSDISKCTITVNDSSSVLTSTDYFVTKDVNETFVQSLSSGNYNWSVECVDAAGNAGTSAKHNLSVNITLPKLRLYDTTTSDVPTLNTSANTTAIAVYVNYTGAARNSIPKYRQWNGVAWSAEGSLPSAGSPVRWVKVAASPVFASADQVTAATLSDDGFIDMYLWNGSSWTAYNNVASIGTTNNAYRAYDVEYETQRGRPMLISGNYTNSTCELRHHVWNGTGFDTGTCIDDPSISTAFNIGFVRVARNPDPLSNEMALIYMDRTNADARALVWNGTSWGQPRNITLTVSITTEECIGIAYEQSSKEILAVAGQATVVAYSTYNGTTWDSSSTIDTNAATASTLNWMTLKPNPAGDDIMVTVVDAQASPDLSAGRWTGTTWTATGQRDPGIDTQASRPADFEWDQTGNSGVMVYATAAGQLARQTYNTVSAWGAPSTLATGANTHTWVLGAINPGTASGDVRSIFMSQEATSQQLDGAAWTGTTLIDQNAAFTTNVGATTYQSFDLAFKRFAPEVSPGSRNISLNESVDAAVNMVTATKANLTMISNATSKPMSEYGTLGFSFPAGSGITFSTMFGTMLTGASYVTWDAYKVNASGEYRLCGYGNKTRTGSDRQLGSSYATVTASCMIPNVTRLQRDDTIRVYTYVNSSIDNIVTKYADSADTYVELDGFPLGNLTLSIVVPTTDPLISEGENMTLICSANCSGGYCENVRVSGEINNTPTTFTDLSYTQGRMVLNSSAENPVIMGTINATTNATYELIGSEYSFNNTLRCSATSEWVNATSGLQNATVLDTAAPNVTLISPEDTSGWDPANFTFTFNASDRRIGSCTLWGNWSGAWSAGETIAPNNGTPTSFQAIELLEYKTYVWNVRCNDTAGNDAFAASNYTFTIAGDMFIDGTEINFSNSNPAEGSEITIFAVVRNRANRNENDVKVAFYLNDPQGTNYTQIGNNITIPFLGALQNTTVNVSYTALLGANDIFVVVDPDYGAGDVFESNEENNIGNTTLYVTIWQVYYGNTSGNISVGTGDNNTFVSWMIQNITGNIYISDSDTTNGIEFPLLRPVGRNTAGAITIDTTDDFEELDALLGTTGYEDNVTFTFTDAGSPRMTMSLQIYSSTVDNIPTINSTIDGNHTTGLLWDADDSTNGYYDLTDSEDIVFVTKIRMNSSSAYGMNDFVAKIPSPLKSYKGTTDTVNLYYEIQ